MKYIKIFRAIALLIAVTNSAYAYTFTSANAAEWNGTYTSSAQLGEWLHTETDVISGNSVSGFHSFTSGTGSGSFTWNATLTDTAHLVGSGVIDNQGIRQFEITYGRLYLDSTTNNFTLYWGGNDPVFGPIGWTTLKAGPTIGSNNGITTSVPEPETYAMLLAGLGLIGVVANRRRGKQA